MDILGVVSYAAKYSAYNEIEHLWNPMSKLLTSVLLPSVLEGEERVPYKQTDIPVEERRLKEALVFDNAMSLVRDRYWKDAVFNGSQVDTIVRKCLEKPYPYDDYAAIHKVRSRFSALKKQCILLQITVYFSPFIVCVYQNL